MLPLLLALAPPQADTCRIPPFEEGKANPPAQESGKGLWIGGIGFGAADILAATPDIDPSTGYPVLEVQFSPAGQARFLEAQRCGVGTLIEISVDREVLSRPRLAERITGDRIQISGGWTGIAEVVALSRRVKPD